MRAGDEKFRVPMLAIGALTALAAILRLWQIGDQSFWLDEAFTATHLDGGLADAVRSVVSGGIESNPPLYYVLAWIWQQAFGDGEGALRGLSALFGIAAVPAGAWLALRLAGPRAAVVTAVLITSSPVLIWYSQEARAYSMLVFLALLSCVMTVEHLERGEESKRWAYGWAIASVLLVMTHYFGGFVVGLQALLILRRRPQPWLALAVVAAATLGAAAMAVSQLGTAAWLQEESIAGRVRSVAALLTTSTPPGETPTGTAVPLLAYGLGAALIAVFARRVARRTWVMLAMVAGLVVLPIVLAVGGVDALTPRNALGFYAIGLVGFAAAMTSAPKALGWAVTALIVAVNAVNVAAIYSGEIRPRDDWRAAIGAVPEVCGDQVLIVRQNHTAVARYYAPDFRPADDRAPAQAADIQLVRTSSRDERVPDPPVPAGFALYDRDRGESAARFGLRADRGARPVEPRFFMPWTARSAHTRLDVLVRRDAAEGCGS